MAFLREGFTVSYIGQSQNGLELGDRGLLLYFASDNVAHTQWKTGKRAGEITIVDIRDIDNASKKYQAALQDDLEDSLEVGPIAVTGAAQVYQSGGAEATFAHLASQSTFPTFSHLAKDALALVASHVRQDRTVMTALASLEPNDQEDVIALVAYSALHDAFGDDND